MSLQGPIIVVAEVSLPDVLDGLAAAGAFPIIEVRPSELATALATVEPTAIILAESQSADFRFAEALESVLAVDGPYLPVIARVGLGASSIEGALPVEAGGPSSRLVARLRAALRVRTLHATVLRRAGVLLGDGRQMPAMPDGDPLDDATVLVVGRGGSYPALVVAIGERTGLVGALSLDAAAQLLRARDIDGLVVGDGFGRRMVESFIDEISSDPRFRDLPVAVVEGVAGHVDAERLPHLIRVASDPRAVADQLLPLVRLKAFTARLRRFMAALDAKGALDPQSGLRPRDVFLHDLSSAIADAERRGVGLSLARFSLANLADRRSSLDAARLVARLIRAADFGCRDADGTILVAFTETEMRAAHVVARRIASVLKHTTLAAGRDRRALDPTVTLAAANDRDNVDTLLARVSPAAVIVAAG